MTNEKEWPVVIGKYTFSFPNFLWLSKEGGESMQLTEDDIRELESLLNKFWKENF